MLKTAKISFRPLGESACRSTFHIRKSRAVSIGYTLLAILLGGCVSDDVETDAFWSSYQRSVMNRSRFLTEKAAEDAEDPLSLLTEGTDSQQHLPKIEIATDPNTGDRSAHLEIEQVLARTMATSPEIQVTSFDPAIAEQEIAKAASDFDPALFGRTEYGKDDNPINSIYEPGQSSVRTFESGLKQKVLTGAEWSTSYAITRGWDDLFGRTLSKRYEPVLMFQLRQPLLSDAWIQANIAGVDVAKLNYQVALLNFRERAETVSTEAIAAYWRLLQARIDRKIQQELLETTRDTLEKVTGRSEIDATDVQIKQVEASIQTRQALLIEAQRQVKDLQDLLVRLMAGKQLTLSEDVEIVPTTPPEDTREKADGSATLEKAIESAMMNNSQIARGRLAVKVADINITVAENKRMPRLDLIFRASAHGLDDRTSPANNQLSHGDYTSYFVGLSLEYPIGNRRRETELLQRRIERRKAISSLQNVADQVAVQVKRQIRAARANYTEIEIQEKAAEAARTHLYALAESEPVRERLTPEFLLVKLQGQESLAQARRAHAEAVANYNIAKAELARATGKMFELHMLKDSMPMAAIGDEAGQIQPEAALP